MADDTKCLMKLKNLRDNANWTIEEDRHRLLRQMYPLIRHWKGRLPNLRDIFEKEEIDWLLAESVKFTNRNDYLMEFTPLVEFFIKTGYKDEPDVQDEDGQPILRRTTPLHRASRRNVRDIRVSVLEFFKIYDRFDLNYSDEYGFTHFHVACKFGYVEIVEKFLELGQDPNCQPQEPNSSPVDSPLQLALFGHHESVVRLLLKNGADPDLVIKKDGSTLLHVVCKRDDDSYLAKLFFKIIDDVEQPIQIDARDNKGNTPLHLALDYGFRGASELLLRHGADSNVVDWRGYTPLQIICMRDDVLELVELFFKINDEKNQLVLIDVEDRWGWTPLQFAVARLLPPLVDLLMDHGADLSTFVFPSKEHFDRCVQWNERLVVGYKFGLASRALAAVERLEKRGYELNRNDALTIMTIFAEYGWFEKSAYFDEFWYDDKPFEREARKIKIFPKIEKSKSEAKKATIKQDLSLYDLVQLPPKQAEKLVTYTDYVRIAKSFNWKYERTKETYERHLCEMVSRGFFRRWALDSFLELTLYQLPILCCDIIVENLVNEDLWHVCLAAAGRSHEDSNKKVQTIDVECYPRRPKRVKKYNV
ncbi:unnamed protein product [Trichogramma brassicae]|uniref:Uncharacterized protein n=1 Tax=Trichogramma brassicae TaxID=86971 RepID=A0A6H5I072_9HYME|nr:unnamed protein product [Trichogramma brassicae]